MSDLRMTSFNRLKNLGQLQLSHMWRVQIFSPSAGFIAQNDLDMITITARTFSGLPPLERSQIKMRYLDLEYMIPAGQTTTHEFTIDLVNDEGNTVFQSIYKWYRSIPGAVANQGLQSIKSDMAFTLLSMDGKTTKQKFKVFGVYPVLVPELSGWDQDATDQHSKMQLKFSFDDVDYTKKV